MNRPPAMQVVERLVAGDVQALARAISLVEEDAPLATEVLRSVFAETGSATVVGITGAPGAGKSSLVDRLIAGYRQDDRRVGIVAVDPSSAYSGGAILGDRVRMQGHTVDPGVFIRSMATRGCLGGLSRATNDAVDLLDAAGYDPVLLETVGVGQDEVDVVKTADVVAVVLVPGMGDDIQAIKAGILEIADLFVINKADHPGADRLQAELEYMLSLGADTGKPRPTIHQTVASRNEGIDELREALTRHLATLDPAERDRRRVERARDRFRTVLADRLIKQVAARLLTDDLERQLVDDIAERRLDPYSAAERILSKLELP